ncbi:MAG: hypothetical protein JRI84_11600 [Deltaproteobacteria bacterium]|nr:hypothetical protein [Deltaproteobacteria bacterium]
MQNKATATPLETLEEKIRIFQEKMEEIKQDRENTKYYFEGEIKRVVDLLDRDLESLKSKQIPRLLEELIKKGNECKHKGISEYVKLMDSTLNNGIKSAFDNWLVQEEERLNVEYGKIAKRYSEKTNEIIESILTASSELFDLNIDKLKTEDSISTDSSLYLMTGDPPKFFDLEGAFDFFSQRILPRKISQKMVLNDLKKRLPQKIDQNCGRVRWDFMDRIKRSFMNFRWDLNQKINTTEESITAAIQKALELKKQSAEDIKKAQDQIAKDLDDLYRIKQRLGDLERILEFS